MLSPYVTVFFFLKQNRYSSKDEHEVSYVIILSCNYSCNSWNCIHDLVPWDSTASGLPYFYLGQLLLQIPVSYFGSLQSKFSLIRTNPLCTLKIQYTSVRLLEYIPLHTHESENTQVRQCMHRLSHTLYIGYPAHTGVCSVEHFEPVQHH